MTKLDVEPPPSMREEELNLLARSADQFFSRHVTEEAMARWRTAKMVDKAIWLEAGRAGFLGVSVPTEYGGAGGDIRHEAILIDRAGAHGVEGFAFNLHNAIVAPYIVRYGTESQKQRWLPKICSGEIICAIAMSEPAAGSDLRGMQTRATRDGDDYVISGQKTFISNGQLANLVLVACKTDEKRISLIGVETEATPGFERGRNLDKVGRESQDTSELFFNDARAPAANLLGETPGLGFAQMAEQLSQERMILALSGMAVIERALDLTVRYVTERSAFGQKLAEFQNTQFKLAECKAEATVCKVFLYWCLERLLRGELDQATAAIAKLFVTEAECRIVDECLQLHGGYGYMNEYPIARMYKDSRIQRIHGGTSEIMKLIIARALFAR